MTESKTARKSRYANFRVVLRREYNKRRLRNPAYSLRAFARDIGLSSSRLSEVLGDGQGISRKNALMIANNLGFSDAERDYFCDLVDIESGKSSLVRTAAQKRLKDKKRPKPRYTARSDMIAAISIWYHFAILELIDLKNCVHSPQWLASQLGISESEATAALERLIRLDLLKRLKDRYVATHAHLSFTEDVPSKNILALHGQYLQKAQTALTEQPFGKRRFDSLLLSIDRRRLPEAFAKIKSICADFGDEFGKDKEKDAVYCLSVQLFSLAEVDTHA